ncbi:hypothetical protein HWV62_9936 [Athelia sp. TMB]|nr:hypothetical protein HWV62_9936 [Athelia sp. TMB]
MSLPEIIMPKLTSRWNAASSHSERHQIRLTLSQVRSDLVALEDTLARITSIQTRLLQKRDALQVYSDELKALTSPIRTIPPEILIEISYYLKGDYRDEAPARARAGSLLPTHVCQQWRQIALSTPSLWNNIYINGSSVSRSIPSSEVKCIKTWLARSKNSPLSINLRWNDGWGGKLDFEEDDVCVTLSPGLTIGTLPWGQLKVFIHGFVMSILQSLTLLQQMPNIVSYHAEIVYDESEDIGFLNTPLHLSKLESLTVKVTSSSFEIDASGWSNQLCALLQVTPQLETLDIDGRALEYDFDKTVQLLEAPFGASSTSCLAPKLQHLNLRYRPPFEPQAFVNMVNSRWRVTSGGCVTPLKSVRLSGIPSATTFNSSELERLRAFAAEGLDIEFITFAGDPILFEKIDSVSTQTIHAKRGFPTAVSGQTGLEDLIQITQDLEPPDIQPVGVVEWRSSAVLQILVASVDGCYVPTLTMLCRPDFQPQDFMSMIDSRCNQGPATRTEVR